MEKLCGWCTYMDTDQRTNGRPDKRSGCEVLGIHPACTSPVLCLVDLGTSHTQAAPGTGNIQAPDSSQLRRERKKKQSTRKKMADMGFPMAYKNIWQRCQREREKEREREQWERGREERDQEGRDREERGGVNANQDNERICHQPIPDTVHRETSKDKLPSWHTYSRTDTTSSWRGRCIHCRSWSWHKHSRVLDKPQRQLFLTNMRKRDRQDQNCTSRAFCWTACNQPLLSLSPAALQRFSSSHLQSECAEQVEQLL